VLFTVAGFQVPIIPLIEVAGNTGAGAPLHMVDTGLNNGTIFGFTATVKGTVWAHCPAAGVKV